MLAGLGAGIFATPVESANMSRAASVFRPSMNDASREEVRLRWSDAVRRARSTTA
jgi:glycerol kinase